jgi:UDP-2,4-diacetamido-2,4,6-trideoxy-beta-L-altropyranose hydrolase
MKVAIRADATPVIGSGHVMRCLTLAGALAARGAQVHFFSRALPAHLQALVTAHGHAHTTLDVPIPASLDAPQGPWPPALQHEDASAARTALSHAAWDWLVVDHYGLDAEWESAMRPLAARLMALDDLGRRHDCDLLLDANHDPAAAQRYAPSEARGARLLLGPAYALLRPEFLALRPGVAVRAGPAHRLFVFLGGMDADNATGRVLEAVARLPAPPAVDVVIGPAHPARAAIEAACAAHPQWSCHVQPPDIARLMAQADAAVGAGGGATLERCCLGLPTLALALAENQRRVLGPAAAAGLVLVPDGGFPDTELLAAHIAALLHNAALRARVSAAGMEMVDGRGADRVAAALAAPAVRVRRARPDDRERLHAWRNAPAVRAVSRHPEPISPEEHRRWFDAVLAANDRVLLVGEDAQGPVGVVRFDLADDVAEVSIHLAPERMGQGAGAGLLQAAEAWLARERPLTAELQAEVLAGNDASMALFGRSGYLPSRQRFSKRIPKP